MATYLDYLLDNQNQNAMLGKGLWNNSAPGFGGNTARPIGNPTARSFASPFGGSPSAVISGQALGANVAAQSFNETPEQARNPNSATAKFGPNNANSPMNKFGTLDPLTALINKSNATPVDPKVAAESMAAGKPPIWVGDRWASPVNQGTRGGPQYPTDRDFQDRYNSALALLSKRLNGGGGYQSPALQKLLSNPKTNPQNQWNWNWN